VFLKFQLLLLTAWYLFEIWLLYPGYLYSFLTNTCLSDFEKSLGGLSSIDERLVSVLLDWDMWLYLVLVSFLLISCLSLSLSHAQVYLHIKMQQKYVNQAMTITHKEKRKLRIDKMGKLQHLKPPKVILIFCDRFFFNSFYNTSSWGLTFM
jgi:hypothetical protein